MIVATGIGIALVMPTMKAKSVTTHPNGTPISSPKRANRIPTFAQRATEVTRAISGLPKKLDHEIRHDPYSALGVACAVGVGVGALFGSRIMRALVVSVGAHAIVELGRAYVRQELSPKTDLKPVVA